MWWFLKAQQTCPLSLWVPWNLRRPSFTKPWGTSMCLQGFPLAKKCRCAKWKYHPRLTVGCCPRATHWNQPGILQSNPPPKKLRKAKCCQFLFKKWPRNEQNGCFHDQKSVCSTDNILQKDLNLPCFKASFGTTIGWTSNKPFWRPDWAGGITVDDTWRLKNNRKSLNIQLNCKRISRKSHVALETNQNTQTNIGTPIFWTGVETTKACYNGTLGKTFCANTFSCFEASWMVEEPTLIRINL